MALFNSKKFKGITSKYRDDSYCLNRFHSFASKKSFEKHIKVCENKDYCYIEIPKKGESLKYHSGVKTMKGPYIIAQILNLYLEKWILVLMIHVSHQQKRKISMKYMDIHCLLTAHSIKKIN